ncbi:MAG: glycosyltransferase [Oscillospiraceae bacterium]|nr:glycosyltransferase [Oscillospiraceae bacterium]
MDDRPLITLVVPVYKVPYHLLRRCLDSVCAQTCDDFEAILIDDGSPDQCGRICDEYAARHPAMRVIHQENGGLSVVRNNGVEAARGDWVCFLDGDDWIEPDTIGYAKEYVAQCGDGDILIWDEYYDIGDTVKENCFFGEEVEGTLCFQGEDREKLIDRILPPKIAKPRAKAIVDLGTANARAYRKAFLQENNVYNQPGLKRTQDNVFNLWAFHKADKVYYRCKRLYHYVYNEEAATQKYSPGIADTMYFLYECMDRFVRQTRDTQEYHQRLYLRFLRVISRCFELDYANRNNEKPKGQRLAEARRDMQRPLFKNAIEACDVEGQAFRIRLIAFLLRHRMYRSMFSLVRVNAMTRNLRLKNRKD